MLAAWQASKRPRPTAAHHARGHHYVDWVEKFDPDATPAVIDEQWVQRYTAFLVQHLPFADNATQHLRFLRHLVAHAGLPATHVKGGRLRPTSRCYLSWEEVQRLHAWCSPADKPSLTLQKDVFVVRCLSGLSHGEVLAWLRQPGAGLACPLPRTQPAPSDSGIPGAVQTILAEISSKYQAWPADQPLPVVTRQQAHHLIGQLLRGVAIDAPYLKVRYKAVVKSQQQLPKWQTASTYTPHHTYAALLARLQVAPLTMNELLGYRNFASTMAFVVPPGNLTRQGTGD